MSVLLDGAAWGRGCPVCDEDLRKPSSASSRQVRAPSDPEVSARVQTQPELPAWSTSEAGTLNKEKQPIAPGKQRLDSILSRRKPSTAQLHAAPRTAKLWSTTLPFKWRAPSPQKNITFPKEGTTASDKTQRNCITQEHFASMCSRVEKDI